MLVFTEWGNPWGTRLLFSVFPKIRPHSSTSHPPNKVGAYGCTQGKTLSKKHHACGKQRACKVQGGPQEQLPEKTDPKGGKAWVTRNSRGPPGTTGKKQLNTPTPPAGKGGALDTNETLGNLTRSQRYSPSGWGATAGCTVVTETVTPTNTGLFFKMGTLIIESLPGAT